ncbi:MAG: trigger factor [Bacteroidales bacterium]|jgi:trigger factor
MNITKKQIDDLSLQVMVSVEEADYGEKVRKALQDIRKNLDLKGFRKGMVPLGLVQKMYGKSTLLEQVQKLVSDALNDYMEKEAIHIIGEPLGSEEQQPSDWDNDKEFSFSFDLMLAPQVNVTLGKDVHMPYMRKKVTDKQVEEYRKGLLDQYGTMQDVEKTEKEDFLKVDVLQGENLVENTYLNLKTVDKLKDKKPFIGKTVGESVAADVSVLLPKEADRVALFQAKPEEWKEPEDPVFTFTIKEIKRFVPAEENQQLYDKLYGPGTVISAEAFVEKIKEQLERNNLGESDYQFAQEVRKRLVEQAGIRLPENLLKRWLYEGNEGKFTMEQIEKDFPAFLEDFRWQLVRGAVMKQGDLKVEKEDMMESAMVMARYQFAMYGLTNVSDEHLVTFAESMLGNEKEARNLYERAEENKVISYIRENVTLDFKEA